MSWQVRVYAKCRPLVDQEKNQEVKQIVTTEFDKQCVSIRASEEIPIRSWLFDTTLDENCSQERCYRLTTAALIPDFCAGFNTTVFAYGQTASGKTHTMFGNSKENDLGIAPRVFQDVFKHILLETEENETTQKKVQIRVFLSCLEIYKEEIRDLLQTDAKELQLREEDGEIVVHGATFHEVACYEDSYTLLTEGIEERSTGDTNLNVKSSRSHAIVTLMLEKTVKMQDEHTITRSKFHLVDLAGSERASRTGSTGNRLQEGIKINQGLLVLGKVIRILSAPAARKGIPDHVPYRESKLTRLLQDSLGGNSRTVMLACISPADKDIQGTIDTLNYAMKARNIQNAPVINVEKPLTHSMSNHRSSSSDSEAENGRAPFHGNRYAEHLLVIEKQNQELVSQIAERDGIISAVRDVLSEASDDLSLQKEEKRWIKSILSLINGLNKSQSLDKSSDGLQCSSSEKSVTINDDISEHSQRSSHGQSSNHVTSSTTVSSIVTADEQDAVCMNVHDVMTHIEMLQQKKIDIGSAIEKAETAQSRYITKCEAKFDALRLEEEINAKTSKLLAARAQEAARVLKTYTDRIAYLCVAIDSLEKLLVSSSNQNQTNNVSQGLRAKQQESKQKCTEQLSQAHRELSMLREQRARYSQIKETKTKTEHQIRAHTSERSRLKFRIKELSSEQNKREERFKQCIEALQRDQELASNQILQYTTDFNIHLGSTSVSLLHTDEI